MSYSAQNKKFIRLEGIEPPSQEPESCVISITLQTALITLSFYRKIKEISSFFISKNLQGNLRCFHRFYLRFPYRHILYKQWLNQVFVLEECHVQGDLQP